MNMKKTCSQCNAVKDSLLDFYSSKGNIRSECKKCTSKRNVLYQKEHKTWRNRNVDEESKKTYMSNYYQNNKEKYAKYRSEFKAKHPDYYKEYSRTYKDKKRSASDEADR